MELEDGEEEAAVPDPEAKVKKTSSEPREAIITFMSNQVNGFRTEQESQASLPSQLSLNPVQCSTKGNILYVRPVDSWFYNFQAWLITRCSDVAPALPSGVLNIM